MWTVEVVAEGVKGFWARYIEDSVACAPVVSDSGVSSDGSQSSGIA